MRRIALDFPSWKQLGLVPSPHLHGVTVFAVFLLVFHLRSPDALLLPQFWAEDGAIFFSAAYAGHSADVLAPYAGYVHMVPRLVAGAAFATLPLIAQPLAYNVANLLLSAFCFTALFLQLRRHGLPGTAAFMLAALPVSGEILGTLTNAQWFLQVYLASACAFGLLGHTRLSRAVELAFIACVAATGPFSVFFALVLAALYGFDATRTELRQLPADVRMAQAALIPSVMLQLHSLSASAGGRLMLDRTVADLIEFSQHIPLHVLGTAHVLAAPILLAALALAVWLCQRARTSAALRVLLILLLASGGIQLAGAALTDPNIALYRDLGYSDRYFYLLKTGVFLTLLAAVLRFVPRAPWAGHALCAALLALAYLAPGMAGRFERQPLPDKDWPRQATLIAQGATRVLDINPNPYPLPEPAP